MKQAWREFDAETSRQWREWELERQRNSRISFALNMVAIFVGCLVGNVIVLAVRWYISR